MRGLLQLLAAFYALISLSLTSALPKAGHLIPLNSRSVPIRKGKFGKRTSSVNVPLDVQFNGTELQV
jgi:hypothetical protein